MSLTMFVLTKPLSIPEVRKPLKEIGIMPITDDYKLISNCYIEIDYVWIFKYIS